MLAKLILCIGSVAAAPALAQTERRLALGEGAAALHGTLLTPAPDATRDAVLILPGSGPTDRDGNNPLGVTAQTYRLLAEGLARRGVATLRIDKRGIGASAAAAAREEDLRIETYAEDARAWATRLKAETGRPCVWLLGHSEGALIAQLAARNNPAVCGLVLVAGPGRKAAEVLREQLSGQLPEPLMTQAMETVTALEAGRTADAPPQLAALFRASVQPYLISWMKHDPAELLRTYRRPVLIVQGTTDLQATVADARRLAAARPEARLVLLEGVNHVLKPAPMDRAANLATYAGGGTPLAPGVLEAIDAFIAAPAAR